MYAIVHTHRAELGHPIRELHDNVHTHGQPLSHRPRPRPLTIPAMLAIRHALLSPVTARPTCTRLRYSTAAHPERIAVLGGGIAGLASAFFASKEFPNSKITIYEGGKELGGWLKSSRVEVPGGDVLFEAGPRTLRNAPVTSHLVSPLHTVCVGGELLKYSRGS